MANEEMNKKIAPVESKTDESPEKKNAVQKPASGSKAEKKAAPKSKSQSKKDKAKKEHEKEEERLKKIKGVAKSNERAPEGMEVVIPRPSGFKTKKYRANLKSFNPDDMIYIKGADKYKKEIDPETRAIEKFTMSMDNNIRTIFTGTVTGMRLLSNPNTKTVVHCALVNSNAGEEGYKGKEVLIGFDDFYIQQGTPTTRPIIEPNDQRAYIHNMRGAEVDFCVVSVFDDNDGNKVIVGSRTLAAKEKFKKFWNGRIKNEFLIRQGSSLEGRVVQVSPNGICVELFGVEFFCPNKELSWQILSDARDAFQRGQTVPVRITKMSRIGDRVECYISIKEATENPAKKHLHEYAVGDTLTGICTRVYYDEDVNKTKAFVNVNNKIDVFATMRESVSVIPAVDDAITLQVTGINEEEGTIWGEIRHIEARR